MKYLNEFRDSNKVLAIAEKLKKIQTKTWCVMEVFGGQTHSIMKNGLDQLLPNNLKLLHGPGCPVCVTPAEVIGRALALAQIKDVIFCTFGDMMRVPSSEMRDLYSVKANGADVRILYSPLEALEIAQGNPTKEVIFFGVGFETTAPVHALALKLAKERGLKNFSMLLSLVKVPPALKMILDSADCRVDGFLAAGHVCTVNGAKEYESLVSNYKVPIVITGFEPLDIMMGLYMLVLQLEVGRFELENQYARSVKANGNPMAQNLVSEIFESSSQPWRGIGPIADASLSFKNTYKEFDADWRFKNAVGTLKVASSTECRCGEVMLGKLRPIECPAFAKTCSPENPLGPTMVSAEGACAAYYKYKRVSGGVSV